MKKIAKFVTGPRILIIPAVAALVLAAVFFGTQQSVGNDLFSQALEGGELTLTSVGRNYESLTQFAHGDDEQARQLLEGARSMLDEAKAKLSSAGRSSDEYLLGMLDNYQRMANASDAMAHGVDNLLFISENLTKAIDYYYQGDFERASAQASYCLQKLTPLLRDFNATDVALSGINFVFVPFGRKDRLSLGVVQYMNETEIYSQYILLLRTMVEGKDYMQMNEQLQKLYEELQSAIANKDYQTAQDLRQKISDLLQSLRDPRYQTAADLASQLDPSMLRGTSSTVAGDLRSTLRNLQGLDAFQNYVQSLQKYVEALQHYEQGQLSDAEQSVNEGIGILAKGQSNDPYLQSLYTGLLEAFNTLQQRIKGQPNQG